MNQWFSAFMICGTRYPALPDLQSGRYNIGFEIQTHPYQTKYWIINPAYSYFRIANPKERGKPAVLITPSYAVAKLLVEG